MSKDDTAEQPEGVGWHVGGLLFFGGLNLYLNGWHALHAGGGSLVIGLIVGVVPPAVAAYMSHDVAKGKDVGLWAGAVWLACALGMALSINAQAAVVRPYAGDYVCWAFPLMIDVATFYSLSRLVAASKAKAQARQQRAEQAAQARAQALAERKAQADARQAQALAEAQAREAQAEAERARAQAQADAEGRAQAEAERAQAREAERAQAEQKRAQARVSKRAQADTTAGPRTGPGVGQAEWQDRIRAALDADPGLEIRPSTVGAALDVDPQIRASGAFKRAVAAVRAERESAPVRLAAVGE